MRMLLRRMSSRAENEMTGLPGADEELDAVLGGGPEMEESALLGDGSVGGQGKESEDISGKMATTAIAA